MMQIIEKIEDAGLTWSVRMRHKHELINWHPEKKYVASIGIDWLAEVAETPETALTKALKPGPHFTAPSKPENCSHNS